MDKAHTQEPPLTYRCYCGVYSNSFLPCSHYIPPTYSFISPLYTHKLIPLTLAQHEDPISF